MCSTTSKTDSYSIVPASYNVEIDLKHIWLKHVLPPLVVPLAALCDIYPNFRLP
jgi:hypothetical protein